MPKSWEKINFVALFQCKEKRVLKRLMFCACTCVCVYEDNEGLERIYLMQVLLFVSGSWPYSYPVFQNDFFKIDREYHI